MDSDKLFIPDNWIHRFVLETRQFLFSRDTSKDGERGEGRADGGVGAAREAGAETSSWDV